MFGWLEAGRAAGMLSNRFPGHGVVPLHRLRTTAAVLFLLLPVLAGAQGLGTVQVQGIEGEALDNVHTLV